MRVGKSSTLESGRMNHIKILKWIRRFHVQLLSGMQELLKENVKPMAQEGVNA